MATPQTVWTAKTFAIARPPPQFPDLPQARTPVVLNKSLLNHIFSVDPLDAPHTIHPLFTEVQALEAADIVRALAGASILISPWCRHDPQLCPEAHQECGSAPYPGPSLPSVFERVPPALGSESRQYCPRQAGQPKLPFAILLGG